MREVMDLEGEKRELLGVIVILFAKLVYRFE
jgi:hypothetical protein